ncbi:MAG: DUF1015 domain-containing protein [Phycisphaerae bacterium]
MPEVAPFSAIRFDERRSGGDLSAMLAPPYDVLDRSDKDALLAKSEHNIVAIDLPHIPPKSAGPAGAYEKSARLLQTWLSDGTLVREKNPAMYLYHQRFEHAGRPYTRRMLIARVRLEPFSKGLILPHEQTFGGPKEDRLALMKATKSQLSPIFGLYTDPEDRIGNAFAATASNEPDATGTLEGVENRMWIVTDASAVDTVVSTLADKKLYIADGHHRYGTALLYCDWLADQCGGSLLHDHPANYVMFVLASMDDPGCLILPYNRALTHVELTTVLEAWSEGVSVVPTNARTQPAESPPSPTLDKGGIREGADLVLYDGRTGSETPLRFANRDVLATLEPDQCEAWLRLDYAYLHRYLIDELLTKKLGGKKPEVRYVKSTEDAKQSACDESGVALLMGATPMAHLRAVSESGGLMPQKSTYFHPKLATGLTINPLT